VLFFVLLLAWLVLLGAGWVLLDRGLTARVQAAAPKPSTDPVNLPTLHLSTFAPLAGALLLFAACRDGAPEAPSAPAAPTSAEETVTPLHEARFGMAWGITPAPQAGQPVALSYTPQTADGAPIAALDTMHEKLSHLIIVSRDLSFFEHVHAEQRAAGGAFTMPYTFAAGGPYVLFADYTPTEANTQLFRHEVAVGGETAPARPLGPATTESTDRGLTVTLGIPEGGLKTGAHLSVSFRVRDAKGDVADLQPYLGAGGHVVVIPESTQGFLHVHPEEAMGGGHAETAPAAGGTAAHAHEGAGHGAAAPVYGPELRFMTTFPAAGRYKLWLQVRRAGQLHTFPFVLDVAG